MKQSSLVLSLAVVAMAGSAVRALPFYSPDYTFDSTTWTGFFFNGGVGVTPDGRAVSNIQHYLPDDQSTNLIAIWRGQTALPLPQDGSGHLNPGFRGMSRNGWICGFTEQVPHTAWLPALWRPDGSRIDLPLIPASLDSIQGNDQQGAANDVNETGIAVGFSYRTYTEPRPVYWTTSAEIVELANPFVSSNQYWEGYANSISSTGIIAGKVSKAGRWHAMRWDVNGTAPILSQTTDTGITFTRRTEAFKSLDDGTILGWGSIVDHSYYGVLWTPDGDAIDLRALPDSNSQLSRSAYAVNNNHYSAGISYNPLGHAVGTRWSPTGEPFALDRLADAPSDALDSAEGINDFNFVVGSSWNGVTTRAVLWTPDGDAIEMQSLIDSDEWSFYRAITITNTGWIAGIGRFDPSGPAETYDRPFSILVPFAGTYGMGDANFDESIDFADLLIVAQHYASSTGGSFDAGDFNLDGVVDFTDLLAIAQNYGDVLGDSIALLPEGVNPTFTSDWQTARAMVPEPGAIGALIGIGVMSRRRPR